MYDAIPELVSAQLVEIDFEGPQQDADSVDEAIKTSITPEFVQESIESVINGTYDFLNEDAKTLEFSIETKSVIASLEKNLLDVALERIEKLPQCESETQARAQTNPLEAECRPVGVSASEFKKLAKQELDSGGSTKIPNVVTADYLLKQSQNSADPDSEASTGLTQADLQNIRTSYQIVKDLPYWFLGGVVAFGGLLYLVYRNLPKWLSRVSGVMISAGVLAILSTLVWHLGSGAIAKQAALRTAGASQVGFETIERLVGAFAADIATLTYILAGVTFAIGLGLKIYLAIRKQRIEKSKPDLQPSIPTQTPPDPPHQP